MSGPGLGDYLMIRLANVEDAHQVHRIMITAFEGAIHS
jgi:hypothetical protein